MMQTRGMPAPMITALLDLYREPAVYERERRTVFRRTWQLFGLEADIPRRGDYLADTLAGYPLVVVRDDHGGLSGYHNLCRHRAGPLVGEEKGRCDGEFVCRIHKWRYGFDGGLREATGFGPADSFDTAALGLLPIRVERWRGLVFVNLDGDAAPLAASIGPLERLLGPDAHRTARVRHRHAVACNWKVYVENFLDGFHLEIEDEAHPPEVILDGDVAMHADASALTAADGLWAWLWPNLGVTIYRGVLLLEHMRPDSADRMQIEHIFLHAPEDAGVDAAIHASERVTEDRAWDCERVQQNLDAGVYRSGVLSPTREGAVAWFQDRARRAVEGQAR